MHQLSSPATQPRESSFGAKMIRRPWCCHSHKRMNPQRKVQKEISSAKTAATPAYVIETALPAMDAIVVR
jgi:hypothetical protein